MAKLKADIVSHFGTAEDIESDGYKVGTLRLGTAKIRRGDRVVAELRVGIQIPTDSDDSYKLAIILSPTGDELGFDADKSLEALTSRLRSTRPRSRSCTSAVVVNSLVIEQYR
jgi:hypothetical protein